jgi:membrane protease YdiL (CAAX protease family)
VTNQHPESTVQPSAEGAGYSDRVTGLAVAFELVLALLAAVGSWAFGYQLLAAARPTLTGTMVGVLATVPLLGGLWFTVRSDWAAMRRLRDEVERHVLPLFVGCSPLQLAAIAVAAGIGEELLFRGLAQGALTEVAGPLTGLLVTSVLFGLAHFITGAYALLAAVVGLYLGGLALLMDGIWAPVVVHSLYDFIALTALTRWRRPAAPEEPWGPPPGLNRQAPSGSPEGPEGKSIRSTTASKPENPRSGS